MVLPHELVNWLLSTLRPDEVAGLIGEPADIRKLWDHMARLSMDGHPSSHSDSGLQDIVPLGIHGDDFRFGQSKLIAVSLNFPLGHKRGRYPLFVIRAEPWA